MGVGGQRHAPAVLPREREPVPLYSRLGGPQSRSGRARKISPPPGFDPRAVQPAASRYTDYAIWKCNTTYFKILVCRHVTTYIESWRWSYRHFNLSTNWSEWLDWLFGSFTPQYSRINGHSRSVQAGRERIYAFIGNRIKVRPNNS